MRITALIVGIIQCWVLCSRAETLPFEHDFVEPFYSKDFEVVWAATNTLPRSVRVYNAVPPNFSELVVSNVVALGGTVNSKSGTIHLYRQLEDSRGLQDVPGKARAVELATNFLSKLEIPLEELERDGENVKAWFSPSIRGYFDKSTQQNVKAFSSMGIEFRRMLDGFICYGQLVRIRFESRESLTQLEARWFGLQALKSYPVASPEEITAWIKEGRARAHPIETTGSRWINVADIRRVIIRDFQIVYDAGTQLGDYAKLPSTLFPYAILDAEIEFSADDTEALALSCPIIKEALSKPILKSVEFNILPRSFYREGMEKDGA